MQQHHKTLGSGCVSDRKRLNQTNLFQAAPERLAGRRLVRFEDFGWLVRFEITAEIADMTGDYNVLTS